MSLRIRKLLTVSEETRTEAGRHADTPLRKAAALAVIANPYAGRPFSEDLSELVDTGAELGRLLGETAAKTLGAEVQSYGKAALVGLAGEQEHAVAAKIGAFGTAVRESVGDGKAWLSSVSKRCPAGTPVDVPLASKDDIWVRSHYDTFTVAVPDAPLPDEIVVVIAVASGGRLNARVGGLTRDEALRGETG
ncbi:MAG: amino acid synthesis family protein [Actinomycetota bacterium]|nr:amino acid synthesis family protein [Actinomycetota bacterium]